MSRLKHFDSLGTARFITISCAGRRPLLANDAAKKIVIEELNAARCKHQFKLFSYVIMPNHVHLVLHPSDNTSIGPIIGEVKARSARRILQTWYSTEQTSLLLRKTGVGSPRKRVFWTPRCFDHNCRNTETTLEKINYCHMNPVKAGLVCDPAVWKWSSYNCYKGSNETSIKIDRCEI